MLAVPNQALFKEEELLASGLEPFWSSWQGLGFYALVGMRGLTSEAVGILCEAIYVKGLAYHLMQDVLAHSIVIRFLDQVTRGNYYYFKVTN